MVDEHCDTSKPFKEMDCGLVFKKGAGRWLVRGCWGSSDWLCAFQAPFVASVGLTPHGLHPLILSVRFPSQIDGPSHTAGRAVAEGTR